MKLHAIYVVVIVLLLAGNLWFAYSWLSTGVTLAYRDGEVHDNARRFDQLSAALLTIAKNAKKEEVVAAMQAETKLDAYEKDGCIWVGRVGLKFENDRLVHVSPDTNSGELDPCFPK